MRTNYSHTLNKITPEWTQSNRFSTKEIEVVSRVVKVSSVLMKQVEMR